jgi:hypothetical protein
VVVPKSEPSIVDDGFSELVIAEDKEPCTMDDSGTRELVAEKSKVVLVSKAEKLANPDVSCCKVLVYKRELEAVDDPSIVLDGIFDELSTVENIGVGELETSGAVLDATIEELGESVVPGTLDVYHMEVEIKEDSPTALVPTVEELKRLDVKLLVGTPSNVYNASEVVGQSDERSVVELIEEDAARSAVVVGKELVRSIDGVITAEDVGNAEDATIAEHAVARVLDPDSATHVPVHGLNSYPE